MTKVFEKVQNVLGQIKIVGMAKAIAAIPGEVSVTLFYPWPTPSQHCELNERVWTNMATEPSSGSASPLWRGNDC